MDHLFVITFHICLLFGSTALFALKLRLQGGE